MKPNPKLIATGSILTCALTLGTYSALSVYMAPIAEKFSTDLSQVALIFTMCSICGLITSLLLGNIINFIGIKKFIIIEGIATILFFASISFTNSIIFVFICAFLFGLVNGGFGVCQTEISVWFTKGQGTLISLLSVGMGIVAMILSPLLSNLLLSFDVSNVSMIHGLIVGVVVILIGIFMMAEPPAKYGMTPVGFYPESNNPAEITTTPKLTVRRILKFPAFWLIVLAGGLFNFVNGGIISNASTLYQSIGANTMQASLCISIYNGVLLVFSPLFGAIADTKKGIPVGVLIITLSTFCGAVVAMVMKGLAGSIITAILISACGVCGSLGPVALVKTFGSAESGSLIGYAMTFGALGQMVSAPLAANIFVSTGSFNLFMIIAIAASALVAVFMIIATNEKSIVKIHTAAGCQTPDA